jgi:hypothetical protein
MSDDPNFISVVVTAFNRKQFLIRAVRSVLSQTLSRSSFEVIVVKNFMDHDIDAFIDISGVRSIFDSSPSMGVMYRNAIRQARGGIICFLDDDDEFYPEKLRHVLDSFNADSALIYVRNSCSLIDPDGNSIAGARRQMPQTRQPIIVSSAEERTSKTRDLYRGRAGQNMSCISLRTSIISRFESELPHILLSPDVFSLYCALASDGVIRCDPAILTRYRVHPMSTSRAELSKGSPASPIRTDLEAMRQEHVSTIRRMTKGTPAEEAARLWAAQNAMESYVRIPPGTRPSFRNYSEMMVYCIRYRIRYHLLLLACALLNASAYGAGSRVFFRFNIHSLLPGSD